jgi:prepilin-type N-terminal cleavage/methylation domain-containing protein
MYKNRGFTLIELLIVVTIIGLLTTGAILGVTNSKRTTSLDRAANEVLMALRGAQNKSLITQQGITNNAVPCGFGIHHSVASEDSFIIFSEDTSGGTLDCIAASSSPDQNIDRLYGGLGDENIIENFTLTENNYVKIANSFDDIYFEPPDGLTYINGIHDQSASSTSIILCLRSDCSNYRKEVRVFLGGNIEIID